MGDLGLATAHKPKENLGLRVLETYKKFKNNGDLFDCWIKIGGKEFPVHSLLLAATSESLKNKILSGDKEIPLEGVKREIVERCIDLLYGEHGEDLEDNMADILQVSSKIKFEGVKDFCFDFMEENLTVQNCFTMVERAKSYDRTEDLQSAEKFIAENFKGVIETQEFLLLRKEDLLHYIEISNADHRVIWKAVTKWIDGAKQDKLLPELMNAIDIKTFPIEFLMDTVSKKPRVQDLAKEVVIQGLYSDLEKLKEGITIDNCFSIKNFNQAHNTINKQAVKMAVTRFMAENLSQIKDKEDFMLMDLQDLTEMLQASELPPAIEKWEAVVCWTKRDSNREIYFSQLVDALNIETFTFDFLLGVIWEEHRVRDSKQLKKKIATILLSSKQKFEDNTNVDNCFLLTNINLKYNSVNPEAVSEMLRNFMAKKFDRIMEKQEYLKLEKDVVAMVVKNAETSEMTKWQGLIKWIYFQKSRDDYIQEMISALKLEQFSFNFLLEQVYNEPLVQKFESVKLQVIDCLLSNLPRLKQNITKENCLALKKMLEGTSTARRHSEAEKIVNRHVMFHLESVILEMEFPSLSYDSLVSILLSPESVVQSDAAKWEAVLRWVRHGKTREIHLLRLTEILDFQDTSFVLQAVWKEPLVQDCEAAKVFVITHLFHDVTMLHEILTIDNCFFIMDVNKKQNSTNREEVGELLVDFMSRNFEQISERQGFMGLAKHEVAGILEITTATEIAKWQAMIKWIKFEESRENLLEEMMKAAKENEFSFDFLLQTVYNEPLVQKSDSTKSLVINSVFFDLKRLDGSINESNCLELKQLLDNSSTKQDEAGKIVNRYLALNLGSFSEHQEFWSLNFKDIISLFKVQDIIAQSDKTKWESVLRWVKHEKTRDIYLPQLLDILKLQDLSILLSTIWEHSLVQASEEAKISVVNRLFADLRKLEANINIDNCFLLQDLNEAYNHVNREDAGEILIQFMTQHFGKEEFLEFDEFNLSKLIMSPDMKASVRVRFESIMKWVKHVEDREHVFPRLFKLLDLKAMDIEYVRDVVMKEPLVKNSQECLLHLCMPDEGQHPNFTIFDRSASEVTVLSLKDGSSHSVSMALGDPKDIRGMATAGGEVYLVTTGSILKLQSDGRITTLQHLEDVWNPSQIFEFQEKIYIVQPLGNSMLCFDPADNSFIDDLPGCGLDFDFCASSTEDSIYAMGGYKTENKAKRFDARTRTWSDIASMSKERHHAAAAALDGKIYLMGGLGTGKSSVECYWPESNSWTKMPNMNATRSHFSVSVFNDRLYAVGGDGERKENGFYKRSIEVYNKQLDRWMMIHKYETSDWMNFACIWPHEPPEQKKATTKIRDETRGSSRQRSTGAETEKRSDDALVNVAGLVSSFKVQDLANQLAAVKATIPKRDDDIAHGVETRYAQLSEMLNQRIKTKSTKSKIISPLGGLVTNFGWMVTFPAKAFDKDTEMETSVITDFSDCPRGKIPIAPIIECSPPGRMNRPAFLEAEHWAFPTSDDAPVYAEIFRKDSGDTDWQFVKRVRIIANQKISFTTDHFSLYEIVVEYAAWFWAGLTRPLLQVTLQNLVYISGVDQSMACVSCLKDAKVRHDVLQTLENTGYRSILPLPAHVHTYRGKEVKLAIRCVEPQDLQILSNDEDGNVFAEHKVERQFRVNAILNDGAQTCTLPIRLQNGNLKKFDGVLTFSYLHSADGDDNVRHLLQMVWPIPGADPTHRTTVNTYGTINTKTIVAPDAEGAPQQ